MELANKAKEHTPGLNKLRFYSSALPRAFQTGLLSALAFGKLYPDTEWSIEKKITKIPFFSETPEKIKLPKREGKTIVKDVKMVEKGEIGFRDNRITSRTMSKGEIYAVDKLISSFFQMDSLINHGEPLHIDYSRLNPTFTLHDNESKPIEYEELIDGWGSNTYRIIIMRHAESCANAVKEKEVMGAAFGVGLGAGVGAGFGLTAAGAAGLGAGIGAGVTGLASAVGAGGGIYKGLKGGGKQRGGEEIYDTNNIYDLTFVFICKKDGTRYYDDNFGPIAKTLNKGDKVEGKFYENNLTLYVKVDDSDNGVYYLLASDLKQIEVYKNADNGDEYKNESFESSRLALLLGNDGEIFNKWEKELIREVTAPENENSLLVFVGHGKWIQNCLFEPHVEVPSDLEEKLEKKKNEFEPKNTSAFLLEFAVDRGEDGHGFIENQYNGKKFQLIDTLTHGGKYEIEDGMDFSIDCSDGNTGDKYCVSYIPSEVGMGSDKIIGDYTDCNYPDDNSALTIMQLALDVDKKVASTGRRGKDLFLASHGIPIAEQGGSPTRRAIQTSEVESSDESVTGDMNPLERQGQVFEVESAKVDNPLASDF